MNKIPEQITYRGRVYKLAAAAEPERVVTAAEKHWHIDVDVHPDHPQFGENTERSTFDKQSQAEAHFDSEVARYKSSGFTVLPQRPGGNRPPFNIKKEVLITKKPLMLTLHECTEDDAEPPAA
jgi:hypothetical protein